MYIFFFIKTKVIVSRGLADFGFLAFKDFYIIWLSMSLNSSLPGEGYSRHASCAVSFIYRYTFIWYYVFILLPQSKVTLAYSAHPHHLLFSLSQR